MSKQTSDARDLIRRLVAALDDHHQGTTTTRPFAETWERDKALLEQAARLLEEATDFNGLTGIYIVDDLKEVLPPAQIEAIETAWAEVEEAAQGDLLDLAEAQASIARVIMYRLRLAGNKCANETDAATWAIEQWDRQQGQGDG